MTSTLLRPTYIFCALLIALAACTKDKNKDQNKTTCFATVYGYNTTDSPVYAPSLTAAFGTVDLATATATSTGTITTSAYSNQGAFNTSDNCYYVFRYKNYTNTDTLYKITSSGAVTICTATSLAYREGLIYNEFTHKLYCLERHSTGPADIVEVTTSGSSFTTTIVGATTNIAACSSPTSATVDNATGKMYFALTKTNPEVYNVETYTPGSTTTTVLASGTDKLFMGLRFNKNDNMLYAIRENYPSSSSAPITYDFVKIAPSSGSVSTIAALPFEVNNEFYSAAINSCSDRYILSTLTGGAWLYKVVRQLNMSGVEIQTDSVAGFLQGLDVKY